MFISLPLNLYIKSRLIFYFREVNIKGDDIDTSEEDNFNHLAELCALEDLREINLSGSDFFSHSLFQFLDIRGDQITNLVLCDIDEMNLNAVILIGDRCPHLRILALVQCHFQMEIGDTLAVERIVDERYGKDETRYGSFPNKGKNAISIFLLTQLFL